MGHELTKIHMYRVCSVSVHLRKSLDLCALKSWWIKETWKCILMQGIVKSCLPEVHRQTSVQVLKVHLPLFQEMHKAAELELGIWACLQKVYF